MKEQAYIFDVDGTLAKMDGRSPYDWERVGEDKPNLPVVKIAKTLMAKNAIIIVTGRDGSCEQATRDWLMEHGIAYDEFHIRPPGNVEKDSVVKKRIFEDISKRYEIIAVFDDRDQVVQMWRSLGLTCLQVDYGNF